MKPIISNILQRKRTILLLLFFTIVAGVSSMLSIPKEAAPDVDVPVMYTSIRVPGAAPNSIERLVIRHIEREFSTIEGVKAMTSTASFGHGSVVLEFEANFDSDAALEEVKDAMDEAEGFFPKEAEKPEIHEINVALFPIISVVVYGKALDRTLYRVADALEESISQLSQVLEVNIKGKRKEVIEITIEPLVLKSYNMTYTEVLRSLSQNNVSISSGKLNTSDGSFPLKIMGEVESLKDLLEFPIFRDGDHVVILSDLATVRSSYEEATSYARYNGEPALVLEIVKKMGENIIETSDAVHKILEVANGRLPQGVEVRITTDQSTQIKRMVSDLGNSVILSIFLVFLAVLFFVGARTATLVCITIPSSLMLTFMTLNFLGFTVNMVVLFAMILASGMLVDGAVIVAEYADRKLREGHSSQQAFLEATTRMFWPILTSTSTTLMAFLPLMFWPGIVGKFMKYLPLTLLITLSASLVMALIVLPTLGSLFFRNSSEKERENRHMLQPLISVYVRFMKWAVYRGRNIALVLGGVLFCLAGIVVIYKNFGRGVEFFPYVEPENAYVKIHARGNASLEKIQDIIKDVEIKLREKQELFEFTYATIEEEKGTDVVGKIDFTFVEWYKRPKVKAIIEDLSVAFSTIPGVEMEIGYEKAGPPSAKDIIIRLSSEDSEALLSVGKKIRSHLESIEDLRDIADTEDLPGIEWKMTLNEEAVMRYGTSNSEIGLGLKLLTTGLVIGAYKSALLEEDIDILLRYPKSYRNLQELKNFSLKTSRGDIPLDTFMKWEAIPRGGTIRRVDQLRAFEVNSSVTPGVIVNDKIQEIRNWLGEQDFPSTVEIEFVGQLQDQKDAAAFLQKAFAVAIVLMLVILLTQFNSFYQCFLVLTAVVMSTLSGLLGLLIVGKPFSIVMSGVGVIALAGVVVNNNIVLIDTYNYLRRVVGMEALEAIVRTGEQRLRPVFITAFTTVIALLPMMLQVNVDIVGFEISRGAPSTQWWVQQSSVVAAGLAVSTILTLVATPCFLALGVYVGRFQQRLRKKKA